MPRGEPQLLICHETGERERRQDTFATLPMPVCAVTGLAGLPAESDEEELYRAFEQAISLCLLAARLRESRISGPLALSPSTSRRRPAAGRRLRSWLGGSGWRCFLRVCLALTLILCGFDLMGLFMLLCPHR